MNENARAARPDVRTPVTLLTGFLGSGKTTLLNRALRDPSMARTAVVINEFGDVSIDHALIVSSNDDIMVLQNGCLCCTVFGDLIQTFNRLYHAREAGEVVFDHVVIETSGLADATPVVQAFLSDPTLAGLFRIGRIVTTVDAINGMHTLTEHAVSVGQVALADSLLITKMDLVSEAEKSARLDELRARLRRLNRHASIQLISDPQVLPMKLLRDALPDPTRGPAAAKQWLDTAFIEVKSAPDPAFDKLRQVPTHLHDPTIASFSLIRETPLPRDALQLLVSSLEQHLGPGLLRVKGLVSIAEDPRSPRRHPGRSASTAQFDIPR